MGEALSRLSKVEPTVAAQITHYKRIISFRNVLIHGYDAIDDAVIWDVIETHLSVLRQDLKTLWDQETIA